MKDILHLYKLYLQTLINVNEFGNKYGDEKTLKMLERDLYEEPKQKLKKNQERGKMKKLILLLIPVLLLTGCNDNKECIKSHIENRFCYYPSGGTIKMYYCPYVICDEYKEEN